MTGQDTLLRWRMAGRRPAQGVLVEVAAKRSPFVVTAPPEHSIQTDGVALLTVAPDEPVERIDWRCVVGLPVAVLAYTESHLAEQVKAICRAASDAGASRVIGLQADYETMHEVYP